MPALSTAEANKAKMDLQAASCPTAAVDAIVNHPQMNASLIQAILAWIAQNPGAVTNIWALIQIILAGLTKPVTP